MSYFFPKLCLVASLALIPNLHAGFLSTIVNSVSSEPISEDEKAHPQAYEYYKSGIKKHDAKAYQEAIEEFSRAIEAYPTFAQAYKRRGDAKGWLNDDQGWKEDTTRAIALGPTNAIFYADRAIAKYYLKDWAGRVADYEKAVVFDPNNQEYKKSLSTAKGDLRWNMVLSAEEKSNPKTYALFQSGSTKHDAKDYKGAILQYTLALESDPKFSPAYRARGNAKSLLGDYQGRIDDLNKAIMLNPDIPFYYSDRGDGKSYLKDWTGQITDYEKAVALNPTNQTYLTALKNAKTNLDNLYNLLFTAINGGDVAQVEKILASNSGIDVNSKKQDPTFLGQAVKKNQVEIVKLLVSKGANVNADYGYSYNGKPLHYAVEYGHQAIVEYLLAHKANINAQNTFGQTSLHIATAFHDQVHKNIATLLIAKGADTSIQTKEGYTAFQWEERRRDIGNQERAEYELRQQRAADYSKQLQAQREATEKAKEVAEWARIRSANPDSNQNSYWQMNADASKRDLENMQKADAARRNADYRQQNNCSGSSCNNR